jgi:hypothetical protein
LYSSLLPKKGSELNVSNRKLEKFYTEDLHKAYSSPNIIRKIKSRRMRWTRHVGRLRVRGNAYSLLVGNPGRTIPLGRHTHIYIKDGI